MLAFVSELKSLAEHKPKDDASLSATQMCNILKTIAGLVDQEYSRRNNSADIAVPDNERPKEIPGVLGLTAELITAKEANDLCPFANAIKRQYDMEDQDVTEVLYQLGQGHMRMALSKGAYPPRSSDEIHMHNKRARLHMKYVIDAPGVKKAMCYSSRIVLAQCESLMKHFGIAMSHFDQVLQDLMKETAMDKANFVCEVHLGRGDIAFKLGEPMKAIGMFQDALSAAGKVRVERDRESICMKGFHKMGTCYREVNKVDMAVEMFTQSLRCASNIGHDVGITSASSALGTLYESIGHAERAKHYFERQYEAARQVGDQIAITHAAGNLGNILVSLSDSKDLPRARELLSEALDIASRLSNKVELGRAQCNLGNVFYAEQNYAEALKLFRSACQRAIESHDRLGQQRSCSNIANVYMSLEQYTLARDWYELGRNVSLHVNDSTTEANTCYNIGCCYLALHLNEADTPAAQENLMHAEENFHGSVSLFERMYSCLGNSTFTELMKLSLFQGYVKAFRQLQFIYCSRKQHEVALELAERSHAMTFNDMLMHKLDSQLERDITQSSPTPLSSGEISSRVKMQTAYVLIFSVCHDQLQIWVVEPHHGNISFCSNVVNPTQQLLSSSAATDHILQKMVSETMESISSLSDFENDYVNDLGVPVGLGHLYDVLIGPVHELLPQPHIGEELVIVPCSALANAAFGALYDTKQGSFLSQMYTIRILPTCRLLGRPPPLPIERVFESDGTAMELEDLQQYDVLAVGCPEVPQLTLKNGNVWTPPDLAFARQEAVNVARTFGCKPLLGVEATKKAVLRSLPHVRVAHFATHGLNSENAIVLAPSRLSSAANLSAEDLLKQCTLTPKDLEQLKLKADLVVLSACSSGIVPVAADGIMGLGRALLLAGAQAVLVTLWDVPDEATELLMRCFYHLVRQEGWNNASALQHAMHQVRAFRRFMRPKYWAAFHMIGRPVLLNFQQHDPISDLFWTSLVPRPFCDSSLAFHTNVVDEAIQWLHAGSSPSWLVSCSRRSHSIVSLCRVSSRDMQQDLIPTNSTVK